jgi:hypothetical protein
MEEFNQHNGNGKDEVTVRVVVNEFVEDDAIANELPSLSSGIPAKLERDGLRRTYLELFI